MPEPTPSVGSEPVVDNSAMLSQKIDDLQAQIADSNKRIAGQTRSWQEERARAEAAEAKLQKYAKYDGLLDDDDSVETPTPTPATPVNDTVTAQLNQVRLELIETKYAANPENREKAHIVTDPKLKKMVLSEVYNAMVKEQQEYGHQISTDDALFAKGVDEVSSFVDTLKADGARIVDEERHNLPSNINLGRQSGPAPANPNPDDPEPLFIDQSQESQKEFFDSYVGDKQANQAKMRGGG